MLSFELKPRYDQAAAIRLIDALQLFGIGASWGGYESLVTLSGIKAARSVASWEGRGEVIRLHIGLEAPQDLTDDLAHGFAAMVV